MDNHAKILPNYDQWMSERGQSLPRYQVNTNKSDDG